MRTPPTPFDTLLDQLQQAVGIPFAAGIQAGAENTAEERCVLIHDGFADSEATQQLPGGQWIGQVHDYQVTIWSSSELEVSRLFGLLSGALIRLLGLQWAAPSDALPAGRAGHKLGRCGPITGGDGGAAGYCATRKLTLYLPVAAEVHQTVTVRQVNATATADAGQGADSGAITATAN